MKVFFSASRRGRPELDKYYNIISGFIEKNGYVNLNTDFFKVSNDTFFKRLKSEGNKFYSKIHKYLLKQAKEADICLFECSIHSLTIGYLIEKSLENNRPVIAFYKKGRLPDFLKGIEDEKFILVEYDNSNLEEMIEINFEKAKKLVDRRFNFFISPDLLTYLNAISKELMITKSTFIRNLIIDHKRKNFHKINN